MSTYDRLYAAGSDAGLAMDLTNAKQTLQAKVDELYAEWSELEELLTSDDMMDAHTADTSTAAAAG